MAIGNTFGATALSSYGGFWISFGIVLTPGGFEIVSALGGGTSNNFLDSFGFFLMVGPFLMPKFLISNTNPSEQGWFIFTTLLLICTMRSTVMFFLLFFWLDMAFLLLGIGYLRHSGGHPNAGCIKAGGVFGILAAFWAWYNAFAGMADSTNSFFVVPVIHFPWSDKGRERRGKVDNTAARAENAV
jgi:succinate-acetate transporter protein